MARELKTSTSDWFCSKLTANLTDADNKKVVGILSDLFWVHSQPSTPGELLRILANSLGFEKFQQTKVESTDVNGEYGDDVRVCKYIDGLAIAINDGQFGGEGQYYLVLDRSEWQTDDLEELELRLFCWALTEGYCI